MTVPSPPDPPPPAGRRFFLWVSGVCTAALLVAVRRVLLPFVLALAFAYLLTPAVLRVQRLGLPRWVAVLVIYIITLGSVGIFVSQSVPRIVVEAKAFAGDWPHIRERARDVWLPAIDRKLATWTNTPADGPEALGLEHEPPSAPPPPFRLVRQPDGSFDVRVAENVRFHEKREGVWQLEQPEKHHRFSSAGLLRDTFDNAAGYLQTNSVEVLKVGREVVFFVSRGIFTLFMSLMMAAYLIATHERILGFFRNLCRPSSLTSFDAFLRRLDRGLAGVVRGQLVICLVNGVLSALGFYLFHLRYWPLIALFAAGMSIIPIFGSILSSIPAVALASTHGFTSAIGVLLWILAIHQLEAHVLNPKIIGDAAKIHPVLVVFALIVGEHFYGVGGAVLALPAVSVVQTVFLHYRERTLGVSGAVGAGVAEGSVRPGPTLADGEEGSGDEGKEPCAGARKCSGGRASGDQ